MTIFLLFAELFPQEKKMGNKTFSVITGIEQIFGGAYRPS